MRTAQAAISGLRGREASRVTLSKCLFRRLRIPLYAESFADQQLLAAIYGRSVLSRAFGVARNRA